MIGRRTQRASGFEPLVGGTQTAVADQQQTLLTVPVSASLAFGSQLVVEVFTPDGIAAGHVLALGSNSAGQTSPTFLAAAGCGVPEPLDMTLPPINTPQTQLVLNVLGTLSCVAQEEVPWLSASPPSGSLVHRDVQAVDVTLDSTGLAPGTYASSLCIDSNSLFPVIDLPVQMRVEEGIVFVDGFESGGFTAWSNSTP